VSLRARSAYRIQRDLILPAALALQAARRKRPPSDPLDGPALESARDLRRIMTRHYALARYAQGAMPVAWVTSGAPVELLRAFGFYTVYPENHGAVCGARRMGAQICEEAEAAGYSQDLCSYARIDLGHALSGKTPVGRLPKPGLLFCANNICQTILYWFKALAWRWKVPLLVLDAPYVHGDPAPSALAYLADQMRDAVPALERLTRRDFDDEVFRRVLLSSQRSSALWGEVLATLKHRPAPMTLFEAFVHLAPVVSLRGLPVCERYYERLLDELRQRCDRGVAALPGERFRLLWDNIAVWFALRPMSRLFAQHGCAMVAGTYTNAWAETAAHLDAGDPFGSLAKAYGLIFLNRDLGYRKALMARLAREYAVDGVVVHSARSCKPYSLGQYDIRRALGEELGLRSVVIEADMADERAWAQEPVKTRLEAFFESLGAA
jgi:benzoyl-CoA reductase/2-hydroxyglutaryl-CoA dehydratase subunit BcrC/BadD/HgdB